MLPLIDLDVVTYRAGFAANKGDYLMNIEYVDNTVLGILERFGTNDFVGYLSGTSNFRKKLYPLYKENRKDAPRPRHYSNIREYLVEYYWANVTDGIEADDAIGLAHTENTVICSTDKDLKTIPGHYYNFVTRGLEYIDPTSATKNFLTQLLTGDKADNIPGILNPDKSHFKEPPNFSDDYARKTLGPLSIQESLEYIYDCYKRQHKKKWKKTFDTMATLLWIQRKGALTYKDCNLLYP